MDRSEASPPKIINLKQGWPALNLLPTEQIKSAIDAVFTHPHVLYNGLSYGPDPGFEPAREAIGAWLTNFYRPASGSIPAERICITGGASQSMTSLLSVFADVEYTRNIWIVAPSYFMAFRTFQDAGFGAKMRGVPEDEAGLDIQFLQREISASEAEAQENGNDRPKYMAERDGAKIYKHVIYCVPTFANPSSRTMSLDRRTALVRLAREFDALIIPDDVYDFLQWPNDESCPRRLDRAVLPRLVDIDRELDGGVNRPGADGFGNACSNGSFSKLAGPGLRVGWVEGSPKFAYGTSQAGQQKSGGAPSHLTSTFFAQLLTTGELQTHILDFLQPSYARRYWKLMHAIEAKLLPLGCTLPQSDRDVVGGYFVWLGLPKGINGEKMVVRAKTEQNLIVAGGSAFEVPEEKSQIRYDGHLRLSFAWEDEQNLSAGVDRLAAAIRSELIDTKDDGNQA